MFWPDVDLVAGTATMHTGNCLHIKPSATERKGVNEMRADGDWFSFNSIGEEKRFFKVNRLNGLVRSCLLCKPLNRLSQVSMASLDVKTPRAGCDTYTVVEVVDTKSNYRRLLSRLLGK